MDVSNLIAEYISKNVIRSECKVDNEGKLLKYLYYTDYGIFCTIDYVNNIIVFDEIQLFVLQTQTGLNNKYLKVEIQNFFKDKTKINFTVEGNLFLEYIV